MTLQRLACALAAAALAAGLTLPALADQTFWSYSTGSLPKPTQTANPAGISIDYVYYPCGRPAQNGRFNPFGARDHTGPITAMRGGRGYNPCYRGGRVWPVRPGQPPRRGPAPPGRVIPLATPRS